MELSVNTGNLSEVIVAVIALVLFHGGSAYILISAILELKRLTDADIIDGTVYAKRIIRNTIVGLGIHLLGRTLFILMLFKKGEL